MTGNKLLYASIAASLFLAVAVPAFAQTTSTKTPAKKTIDSACMQNAVGKRDDAIVTAIGSYSSAATSALQARRDALKAGWALTGKDRRTALKTAWSNFAKAQKQARQTLKSAQKSAWSVFYTDRKACGPGSASEDNGTEANDSQL